MKLNYQDQATGEIRVGRVHAFYVPDVFSR